METNRVDRAERKMRLATTALRKRAAGSADIRTSFVMIWKPVLMGFE